MGRLRGEDDDLKKIHEDLKALESKENVSGTIQTLGLVVSMNSRALEEADKKLLRWLECVDTSTNHDLARKKREPTTGNWLLQLEPFVEWKKATNASLWLHGIPGAGKTILCSTIIEHVKEECDRTLSDQYAYFYFDFNHKRTVVDMLRSIIAQLCTRKKHVPPELHQLYYQCDDGRHQPDQTKLLQVFFSLLKSAHRTFVIMDALDECAVGADRNALLDTIEEMISAKDLNILVTSRREKDIKDKLDPVIGNQVDLVEEIVEGDIALHIKNCLEGDKKLSEWDTDTKNDIQRVLEEKARGM